MTRKEITDTGHFTWLIYYIHKNPIKAGLCLAPGEYRYSSYNAIISQRRTSVAKSDVLEWFGDKLEFIDYHMKSWEEEGSDVRFGF